MGRDEDDFYEDRYIEFLLFISTIGCAGHHEDDLVIFAIDFAVTAGKEKEARNYSEIMTLEL